MKKIVVLIVALALMVPSVALGAGSSTCQSYNPELCSVDSTTATTTDADTTSAESTLPFTGLDVVLLAAGGGVLLGAGLLVRRLSRDFD